MRAGGHRQAAPAEHRRGSAPVARLPEPRAPVLGHVRRVPRHGRHADGAVRVLPARRAGAGGAQAGAVPARAGGRRQVVAGREDQEAVRGLSDLRAEGQRVGADLAAAGIAARPVRPGQVRRPARRPLRHSPPRAVGHRQPVGTEAPAGVPGRSHQVPRRARDAVGAEPDRHRQDRARRREHAGHLQPGRQDRPGCSRRR